MKITKEQQRAIHGYYKRNADGATSFLAFRRRWHVIPFCDGAVGAEWRGMFIGIETDGYGHS